MNITQGLNGRRVMSLLRSSISRSNETRSERISVPLGQHARLTNLQIWSHRLIIVVGARQGGQRGRIVVRQPRGIPSLLPQTIHGSISIVHCGHALS